MTLVFKTRHSPSFRLENRQKSRGSSFVGTQSGHVSPDVSWPPSICAPASC